MRKKRFLHKVTVRYVPRGYGYLTYLFFRDLIEFKIHISDIRQAMIFLRKQSNVGLTVFMRLLKATDFFA